MKKTHRIYARDKNASLDGLKTSRGTLKFGKSDAIYVDESTAKEVDERYGKNSAEDSVFVAKDEQYDRALKGEKWDIVHSKNGDWVKTLHKYRFSGIDTSHLKGGKESRFVWVWSGTKQILMPREQAEEEGYEIVKRNAKTAQGAEEKWT